VSSTRIISIVSTLLLLAGMAAAQSRHCSSATTEDAQKSQPATTSGHPAAADPAQLFQQGPDALNQGRLDAAERTLGEVLALNLRWLVPVPTSASSPYGESSGRRPWKCRTRRSGWRLGSQASVLNIGLAYYRQSEFLKAIPQFESVVRDQPDSFQPRHLLGLCYFLWSHELTPPLWSHCGRRNPRN
jgi:hypothetical protein